MSKDLLLTVIGLGYAGIPLAVAFAKHLPVIGYDICQRKIAAYQAGLDPTGEVGSALIKSAPIEFTTNACDLQRSRFHIVAVPTPVKNNKLPNLEPLLDASRTVGQNLRPGSVVVFESTVYPGVTEDICIPILERESGMRCGVDFKVGYSPERINPGDKLHRLETITKVVSGCDAEALEEIAAVYEMIIEAGVYRAPSIKVAEAAKVIENTQRDINIAFVNELSLIFDRLGIDTLEVLKTAGTKWNFLNFKPGLVGGHCIGVDPYYLTYKAQELGYHPGVILSGRRINDSMGKYIAEKAIKSLVKDNGITAQAKALIMGLTFKENISDIRNSKVMDIVRELEDYGINVSVCDPRANPRDSFDEYGISLVDFSSVTNVDAVILAVAHNEYVKLSIDEIKSKLAPGKTVFIDVKGVFNKKEAENIGLKYWRL